MDFDFYTKEEINAMLGGLSFERISKTDFDALTTKDPDKVYFVYDESSGKIKQYLGDAELSAAKMTAGTIIPTFKNNMAMIAGTIEEG